MYQWQDDTLVAIEARNGKYKVLELPARSTQIITSRKSFPEEEQAEQYIDDQYATAVVVQPEDIRAELKTRKASGL